MRQPTRAAYYWHVRMQGNALIRNPLPIGAKNLPPRTRSATRATPPIPAPGVQPAFRQEPRRPSRSISGIGFGLGAALYGAITLTDGKVEQTNFDDYQVLRIDEMPKVEVHIVPSLEAPTGVGEPGVAPIGPAVANAVFAATGKRLRILPFSVGGTA